MKKNKLKEEYRKKLLERNKFTCLLAIEMDECTQQNVKKLIRTDSEKFTKVEDEIKNILGISQDVEIFEKRNKKQRLVVYKLETKRAAIKQPSK